MKITSALQSSETIPSNEDDDPPPKIRLFQRVVGKVRYALRIPESICRKLCVTS